MADDGRVEHFLEATWGQVFSDTVNTGIYVMEPEIFDRVARGEVVDWSGDVFPALLKEGAPIYGYVADGYWEDVGTHESYIRAQADVLSGLVDVEIDGFEVAPGIWVAEGADVDPDAELKGPLYVGDYAKVEGGAELREYNARQQRRGEGGASCTARSSTTTSTSVANKPARLCHRQERGRCAGTDRGGRDRRRRVPIEEEASVSAGVKIYPFKTIEAGAVVMVSVIWEARATPPCSGRVRHRQRRDHARTRGTAGRRLATTLQASTVVARDHSRAARALKRAVIAALPSSAIDVRDLECQPLPVARLETSRASAGGVMIRTTSGVPDSVDILFLSEQGADLSPAAQRKLERVFNRQEYRRAFPGEIGDLTFPPRALENYVQLLLQSVDTTGIAESGLKLVVDAGGGAAALLLPTLLGRLGVDSHVVGLGMDEARPTETPDELAASLKRLSSIVSSSQAAVGVHFGPVGERLSIVDERGRIIDDSRALLVFMDLVAAERKTGRVAMPVATTRVAEEVATFHGVEVEWTTTSPDDLSVAAERPGLILAGDGKGGYVIPEFGRPRAVAAFVRLVGLRRGHSCR